MSTAEAKPTKKPWYMKWWVWVIAAVVLVGVIGNALGLGSDSQAAPSTPPATEAVVGVAVPDLVGMAGDEADDALKGLGLRGKFDGGDKAVVMKSNWDVVSTDPAAGVEVEEGGTVTVHVKDASERLAAEQAQREAEYAAAPVDENTAVAQCDARAAAEFPYGAKLHWIKERLASEQRDGGVWFLKVGATITNAFNAEQHANIECWVSGTNGAPVMDEFLAY